MDFSQKLKTLMRERSLSAYKLANDLHCSQTTIRNWIDGRTTPQPRTLIQLCEYFGVSEQELIGGLPAQKMTPMSVTTPRPWRWFVFLANCLQPLALNCLNWLVFIQTQNAKQKESK